jgi:D-alanyl-D-alanine carboxypeptidase
MGASLMSAIICHHHPGVYRLPSGHLHASSSVVPSALVALSLIGAACGVRVSSAPSPAVAELRLLADSLLRDPKFRSANLGILVVDPERGDTLLSHNAGKLFMPASNQKLLTGSVALTLLGPDFRFITSVFADGVIDGGQLRGDLRIAGMGDPSISDHMAGDAMKPLRALADSLTRGITRVTGSLVRNDAFPDDVGIRMVVGRHGLSYSAGVDELFFNEFTELRVRGGAVPGAPVQVVTRPNAAYPLVRVLATTVARDTVRGRRRLAARHDSTDASRVLIEGEIVAGDSATISLAWRDQARASSKQCAPPRPRHHGRVACRHVPDGGRDARATGYSLSLASLRSRTCSRPSSIAGRDPPQVARPVPHRGGLGSGAQVVRDQLLAWGRRATASSSGWGGLSRYNVVS